MSGICSLDLQAPEQWVHKKHPMTQCSLTLVRIEGKRKSYNNWVERPPIQHPFRVSVLQSRTCTSPPFNTGLVQPGKEEMISLSAAAVGAQAVMTHGCAFPGEESHTMDPQLEWEKKTLLTSAHIQLLSSRKDIPHTYWHIVRLICARMRVYFVGFLLLGIVMVFLSYSMSCKGNCFA